MATIAVLNVAVKASTRQFNASLKKSAAQTKGFEGKLKTSFANITNKIKAGTVALTAFAGVSLTGLVAVLRRTSVELDALAKASRKLGIAPEELRALQFAAEQTGVDVRTLNLALQRMTRRVSEAAAGTGEAKAALKELGLDAARLNRLPLEKQFGIVADRLGRVAVQADRVRLGFKLFDSEGVALVNTLAVGSKGLEEFREEAQRLGILDYVTADQLARVERMNDALNKIKRSAAAAGEGIVTRIAEATEEALRGFEITRDPNVLALNIEIERLRKKRDQAQGPFGIRALGLPFTEQDALSLQLAERRRRRLLLGREASQTANVRQVSTMERVTNAVTDGLQKLDAAARQASESRRLDPFGERAGAGIRAPELKNLDSLDRATISILQQEAMQTSLSRQTLRTLQGMDALAPANLR